MNFPRIKDGHRPVRLKSGKIRIGGATFGTASLLEDPNGLLWEVFSLFDGDHSVDEIIHLMLTAYHDQDEAKLSQCVDAIGKSPYIEVDKQETFVDVRRYSRSNILYQWMGMSQRDHKWVMQETIASTSVANSE